MPLKTTVAYRDDNYDSCWIDASAGYCDELAQAVQQEGASVVDADEMRDIMIEGIQSGSAHEKLVVFSQDVVPETILEDYYANTTIREYLDVGGSILWVGDIPCFYTCAKYDNKVEIVHSPITVLGLFPLFCDTVSEPVSITKSGSDLGLTYSWSGR